MRNLVIKREKAFVGFLGKYKVYMVDQNSSDLKINKEPCRKLGTLKNGEETVFQIPDEEVKIYIIADKLTKSFCNELIRIPAGETDAYLLGKSKFNIFLGNPFRLEGQVSEETKLNRKKCAKKSAVFTLSYYFICFVIGVIFGVYLVSNEEELLNKPETFIANEMQITLTQEFVEVPFEEITAMFATDDVTVFVAEELKPIAEGYENITLEEYGNLLIDIQEEDGYVCSDLKNENGLYYFEYQATQEDGTTGYFKEYVYESTDAFWGVSFVCMTEDAYIANYNSFPEWAKSVTFDETV